MKRLKMLPLYIASFLASILPVTVYFLLNLDKYIKTTPQAVRLSAGAVILIAILVIKTVGKLRMPSRVITFSIALILCYLLDSILEDMVIFVLLALVGEVLDLVFQGIISQKKRKMEKEELYSDIERAVEDASNRVSRV